jgi:hypothetical protein
MAITPKWICFLISLILCVLVALGADVGHISLGWLAAAFFVAGFGVVP